MEQLIKKLKAEVEMLRAQLMNKPFNGIVSEQLGLTIPDTEETKDDKGLEPVKEAKPDLKK